MHEFTRVGIELTDGRNFSIKGRKPKVDHRNYPSIALLFPGTKTEPEFVWQGEKINELTYSVQLQVKNTTSAPLPVEKMVVYTTGIERQQKRLLPIAEEEERIPWMIQIIDSAGSQTLVGFTTAREQAGYIGIKEYGEMSEMTAFTIAGGKELDPGNKINSEKVFVSFEKDAQKAVELYVKSCSVPSLLLDRESLLMRT